jgi:mono/diheme cytochrome c family protein
MRCGGSVPLIRLRVSNQTTHWTAALLLLVLAVAIAPQTAAAQSGKQDYEAYCADCHGSDGKGNGPTTQTVPMNPAPPDLTKLAKNNGGKFPFNDVVDIIDGRKTVPSHERIQMPFLGTTLQEPGKEFTPESDAQVKRRIDAMARYVESLQQK